MNGETDEQDDFETNVETDEDIDDDTVDDEDDDDDVDVDEDTVVDDDLETLVARLDKTDADEAARRREIRRRLEEAQERRNQDLDSTFNFNLDDDF